MWGGEVVAGWHVGGVIVWMVGLAVLVGAGQLVDGC